MRSHRYFSGESAEYHKSRLYRKYKGKDLSQTSALILGMSQEDGIGEVTAKVADRILLR
jgi:hypothetical protein